MRLDAFTRARTLDVTEEALDGAVVEARRTFETSGPLGVEPEIATTAVFALEGPATLLPGDRWIAEEAEEIVARS
ncbi:MAG: hypothetical protein U0235_17810 [Polyangiaceae bacterium]